MNIESRIRRIEAIVKPAPGARLLHEPAADATTESREAFEHELSSALSEGLSIIVHRNGVDRLRRPGVLYCDSDFEALLHLLAATPSTTHKNALAELLDSIKDSALPVVREVKQ